MKNERSRTRQYGMGMAKNLLAAGFDVTGFDLKPERRQLLAEQGGNPAETLADLAGADVVFVMVMSGAQVKQVIAGEGGLMRVLGAGATIIVSATIQPAEIRAIADGIARSGLNLIDSPVSGGQFGAEAGTLTMMVAAESAVFAANQDVLNAVGGQVFHVGEEVGMGQTVKAALQALIGVSFVGIFESLALGALRLGQEARPLPSLQQHPRRQYALFKNCAERIMERKFEDTAVIFPR